MEDHAARTRMLERRAARPAWDDWEGIRLDLTPIVCPACYAGLNVFEGTEFAPQAHLMEYLEEPYPNIPFVFACKRCRGCLTPPIVAHAFYQQAPYDNWRQQ